MMEIKITDAQRQFEEGGKVQNLSFWTYKIETKTQHSSFQNPPLFPRKSSEPPTHYVDDGKGTVLYMVQHRYTDFEWLVENLADDFPGEIIPPIPGKDAGGTADKLQDLMAGKDKESARYNPFVQTRLRRLTMFLNMLTKMKSLHDSEALKAFLTMERADWIDFKDQVKARKIGGSTNWDSAKAKAMNFFGSVKKLVENHVEVFDSSSSIGSIRDKQARMATALLHSMHNMAAMQEAAVTYKDNCVDYTARMENNASKPLQYPIVFNGHFVATKDRLNGVVTHVDDYNYAYVNFNDGRGLERIAVTDLFYTPSGVSDPVMQSVNQHLTQMDSFAAYICHRSQAMELDHLVDLLWYWQAFGFQLASTIEKMRVLEQDRQNRVAEAQKSKDKAAKLNEEAQKLGERFQAATTRFENSYAFVFRPLQKKALQEINLLTGKCTMTLLCDSEWGNRLKPADASLQLKFDVPEEVNEILGRLTGGAPPVTSNDLRIPSTSSASVPQATAAKTTTDDGWGAMPAPTPQSDQPTTYQNQQQQQPRSEPAAVSSPTSHMDTEPPAPPPPRSSSPPTASHVDPTPATSSPPKKKQQAFLQSDSDDDGAGGPPPPPPAQPADENSV